MALSVDLKILCMFSSLSIKKNENPMIIVSSPHAMSTIPMLKPSWNIPH